MIAAARETGFPSHWSLDDVRKHFGVPARRIRVFPPPGEATLEDAVRVAEREDSLCELIDGTLVEKDIGWYESLVATLLGCFLGDYLRKHDLGQVFGADVMLEILPNQMRMPDVSFVSWERMPQGRKRRAAVAALAPDVAVEVLSRGNTRREMSRKLREYFESGVRMVWYINVKRRTAVVYSSQNEALAIEKNGKLDGGNVLPGFSLSLRKLFAEANRTGPRK